MSVKSGELHKRVTLYDGASALADLDSAGHREAEYVYDAGTDRPYAMLTGSTTVTGAQYFVQDAFGNVEGTVYDSVNIAQQITYSDWGAPTMTGDGTEAGAANRLAWKGLPYDAVLGLTYMRARWYDPAVGRFMSEDPMGLSAGINPYVFAEDDPINGADPSGMCDHSIDRLCVDTVWVTAKAPEVKHEGADGGGKITITVVGLGMPPLPSLSDPVSTASAGGTTGENKTTSESTSNSVGACFSNHRFSSLFSEGSWRTAAQVTEIIPPLNSAARMATRGAAHAAEHGAESVLVERVIPSLTTGFFTRISTVVVKYENVPMDLVTAFTVSYNATTYAQCALGILE